MNYNIEFPTSLHDGIMRRLQLWRMRRSLFFVGSFIMGISLISSGWTAWYVRSAFIDNEAAEVISTLIVRGEASLNYLDYAFDVFRTVMPIRPIFVALANFLIVFVTGWLLLLINKQFFKGRTFNHVQHV